MTTKNRTPSPLSQKDRQTLESIKTVAEGIAAFFGENCEVVLHTFENLDRSAIHIVNGHVTGRKIGAPITDLGMKLFTQACDDHRDVTETYYSTTADGKLLRSTSVVIRNGGKKPIGMLCINFNMNAPLVDVLGIFNRPNGAEGSRPVESFVSNVEELIELSLGEALTEVNARNGIPNAEKNKAIVGELAEKGIFDIRGAIDVVARKLCVSRYTIYNYIREFKFSS
ncbi:MAG: PAS domain-containing protein [Spirochaetaceae bacterium]|jgi:predicted transcriptional regulator YheO|nr:PAS domain-containing protein [Spirochaetaceae bacterium]